MISVFTIEQDAQWDTIVRTFKEYDVYWLSGYVKAFKIHGDGEPLLFYYEDETCRGINVVMKRDISNDARFLHLIKPDTYFDFSSPYGYGGWLIEGENTAALFCAYEKWCNSNGIISEFVRFHPVLKNEKYSADSYEIVPLGLTVTMDLSSNEVIWNNLTKENRNRIRKAKKNNVNVYSGLYPEIFKSFQTLYNATMQKDDADNYYFFSEDFYQSILTDLPYNSQIFYAEYEGHIIGAAIIIFANGKMNYHLSGSDSNYLFLAPTNSILYEAAKWGCENGYKTLYLGGGVGSAEDTLLRFKKTFYRLDNLNRFSIGKKIFNNAKYDELVEMRKDISAGNFFPKYRA